MRKLFGVGLVAFVGGAIGAYCAMNLAARPGRQDVCDCSGPMSKEVGDKEERLTPAEKEDLRQVEYEWDRIWFNDEPAHLTPGEGPPTTDGKPHLQEGDQAKKR